MRNFREPATQPLLPPVTDRNDTPLGRVTISPGAVTYRAVPFHAYPDGSVRGVHTAAGFPVPVPAGRR